MSAGVVSRSQLILSGEDFINIISNVISNTESQNFKMVDCIGYNISIPMGKRKIDVEFHLNELRRMLMLLNSIGYNKSMYKYMYRKNHYKHTKLP